MDHQPLAHFLLIVSVVISSASSRHVTSSSSSSTATDDLDDDERRLLETGSDVDDDGVDGLRRLMTSSIPFREQLSLRDDGVEGEKWKRVNEESPADSVAAAAEATGPDRGRVTLERSWMKPRRTQSGAGSLVSTSSSSSSDDDDDDEVAAPGPRTRYFDQITANKRKTIKFG